MIYFYDEEGRLVDSAKSLSPSTKATDEIRRLYAVKLVIDKVERPGGAVGGGSPFMPNTYRVSTIFAPYVNPAALAEFKTIDTPDQLKLLDKKTQLKTRSFIISRMGSEKE